MDDKDEKTDEGRWADARNRTRATHGSSHGVDYCGVDQSTGLEL